MNKRIFILLATLLIAACAGDVNRTVAPTHSETLEAPPEPPKVVAGELVGQNANWLRARLGDPGLLRRDGRSEIWQYKSASCVVNVFLYPADEGASDASPETAEYNVQYIDARDLKGAPANQKDCLNSL